MSEVILCAGAKVQQKYYFNPDFYLLPEEVKDELEATVVLFTEEVGGALVLLFDEAGELLIQTRANDDIYYDEIGAGLMVKEIQRNKQELLEQLTLFYRMFFLNQDRDEYGS